MSYWMSDQQKNELLVLLHHRQKMGGVTQEDILRTRMDLETVDAQMKAAAAEEKAAIASERAADATIRNARYMLWSVVAAAVSAIASLGSTAIAVFWHH
jgi:hypothetical protein